MKRMTCRQAVGSLMLYVDDRLAANERRALEAHFGVCDRCVEFADSYGQTPRIVREATATLIPARIMQRLQRQIAKLNAAKVRA